MQQLLLWCLTNGDFPISLIPSTFINWNLDFEDLGQKKNIKISLITFILITC